MHGFDPLLLAQRQLQSDRAKTRRFKGLFERKMARMSVSPLAFLRGAAPLFYEMLRARRELQEGPGGSGWIAGDLHLENFGAYRPESTQKARDEDAIATFNLNDFDDAIVGPWRFDVLRLTTSLLLGSRELGADGHTALALSDGLVRAYAAHAFGRATLPAPPRPVARLIEQVRTRSRLELLEARAPLTKGNEKATRRFVRGDRYQDLLPSVRGRVAQAFAGYLETLQRHRPTHEEAEIVDAALRIAGTGSLGGLRIAVLVRGKGGQDGQWIFDMKEEGHPSATVVLGDRIKGMPKLKEGERVATALRACLQCPPRMIGWSNMGSLSLFVRRLAPQEDKLDLLHLHHDDLAPLASYLGSLLGVAHRRGRIGAVQKAWSTSERERLMDHAIAIAGVHEATYLAYCKLTRA